MNIAEDIRTLEELAQNPTKVIRNARANRRPMMIVANGKPDFVIVPVEVMTGKQTALQAVCELADD